MGVTVFQAEKADGTQQLVFVQTEDGEEPRNAGSVDQLKQVAKSLEQALQPVAAVARTVLNTFKTAGPGKVTVEFGIELGGKFGIPLVTEGSAKANFKVQLTWETKADASGKEQAASERKSLTGTNEPAVTPLPTEEAGR